MGNQPSKSQTQSRSSTQHEKDEKYKERDQSTPKDEVSRRISIRGKGPVVDPSPATDSPLGQTTLQSPSQRQRLQQHLQAAQLENLDASKRPHPHGEKFGSLGHEETKELDQRTRAPSMSHPRPEPSIPVDVPGSASRPTKSSGSTPGQGSFNPSSGPSASGYAPMAVKRPPRVPLAIADEIHAPESPPLLPTQVSIFEDDEDPNLPRKSSMLSSVTQDEDDTSELQVYAVDTGTKDVVPTRIDWNGGGSKVYVTGTFAHWDKKFRLHPRENGRGMTATIGFPPGTHHLKFIVDSEMITSQDLPTTVDIHNILVNYIEVVAEESGRGRRESGQKPKAIPPHVFPPIVLPEEDELDSGEESIVVDDEPTEPPEEEIPVGDFRHIMPNALLDMELSESDNAFRQAYNVINDTAGPPSLPLFLGKSILNGNLPNKDDNSVLTLPNHTVLNHLATSSIKNDVLATSVTTRYKKKYVTTIMYKPTTEPAKTAIDNANKAAA